MELFEALRARESCRAYSPKPLEKEKIEKLLEVACMAPSAGNGQPWRFVAVTDKLAENIGRLFENGVETDIILYLGLCNGAGWATSWWATSSAPVCSIC